ncbi:hypothetical protein L226DRAFT_95210 [Lentinus tigrinus ALCF2SS1-7]|uniref:Uncharacterized protein n=1 Tax=Lentinus tigrinus ALCF2SS1-6 TaxID=1328759 RepID=A0A5C2RPN0_9APHY|nr:hypothetical protein L227DRAFT_395924 [Lentinus tigrinus ALCF2SS1-6]RPD73685.1 hypothetical protein L226DRAFT_95210 [Lentinus tigrinus ALCF2SS1-7]
MCRWPRDTSRTSESPVYDPCALWRAFPRGIASNWITLRDASQRNSSFWRATSTLVCICVVTAERMSAGGVHRSPARCRPLSSSTPDCASGREIRHPSSADPPRTHSAALRWAIACDFGLGLPVIVRMDQCRSHCYCTSAAFVPPVLPLVRVIALQPQASGNNTRHSRSTNARSGWDSSTSPGAHVFDIQSCGSFVSMLTERSPSYTRCSLNAYLGMH